ncbi:glycine cleavage system protein R [Microvirga guangxiensis]|uniref:Glycine cleavage system transcriptional repressor n=1 Tax=Microvirga guangxiensis TaxID=549386 RepID=A0A1G5BGI7_9HYPH|nr:ACT domain-containing protein [Microvirga guangxiensis]SCX89277.1 glycine cleavage system transcriptional repressor [Microvirga guangxiensis]
MASVALVSVLGPDRVGLVAAIAEHLFNIGVNLRDTTFAALGSGAEFVAICELPTGLEALEVEEGLKGLPELEGAEVRAVPYAFDPSPGPAGSITHRITISGGDQLGLVARLAEVFKQYDANIVRLEARKLSGAEGGLYVTRFAVFIPETLTNLCLATVSNTAGALGLDCEVEASSL